MSDVDDAVPADASLLPIFLEELGDIVARLETVGVRLADSPAAADIDEAFRGLHTIKGNAYAMGFGEMGRLVHAFEDVLRELKGNGRVGTEVGELLLEVNDELRDMGRDPARAAPAALLARIRALAAGGETGRVHAAGDTGGAEAGERRPERTAPAEAHTHEAVTIPVGIAELDALFSAVESFRSRLLAVGQTELAGRAAELSRMLLTVRQTPIGRLATRLQRSAREAARSTGRHVRMSVQGSELAADAAVVQDLSVILPHMIRNAIDHGIEPEAERAALGKPPEGSLRLSFLQEHGAFVAVIEDDGRGMSADAIAASAVRKGLASREETETMSDEERLRLIFRAGVSTSARVTEISGRGVGMDVVGAAVQRHGGRVDIASTPGAGSRFELRFPVLFRWEEYLVVILDNRAVGLPIHYVREIVPGGVVLTEPGVATYRGEEIRLIGFRELDGRVGVTQGRAAVVLALGDRSALLPVDGVAGFAATLVQALPGRDSPPCLAGLGQTADGGILWGIDMAEVAREWERYALGVTVE